MCNVAHTFTVRVTSSEMRRVCCDKKCTLRVSIHVSRPNIIANKHSQYYVRLPWRFVCLDNVGL